MKNTIEKLNYRSTATIQEVEGKKYLRGKIPFNSKSDWLGGYYEVIAPTAFRKTLLEQDVKVLMDHDSTKVLGRKANGTARFTEEPDGLLIEVELPDTSYARDAWNLVQRQDVDTMSFGFSPVKVRDEGNIRTLDEVKLFECSFCVPFPAYGATSSIAIQRSWFEKRNIDVEEMNEVLEKKELNIDDVEKVKKLVIELEAIIKPQVEIKVEAVPEKKPSELDTSKQDALLLEIEIEEAIAS